ncbi:hypothetical protein CXG50_23540 [Pseudomonas plecoglossicida]|uniref:Uncharacterized protein n=1 Tax=Pseudomonas plecoglossicida TaxID=70775 RepID=A0ABX4U053_PSEDL|nr:hypothetical protein [Pseudomonas sp. 165]AGA73813.1 hypothetical protein B479_14595 [Pseudomonas putida HB3267]PLP92846.1 hypothetical protein CX682_07600 [Pseudomonas sp. FFUP_PS_41]PLU85527.1 hypothetical protein CXG44_20065 [Pseudomonas plecoglossicida]MDM1711150.1 hypothetical protein [Pseudomonas sp. 165]PLU91307.1 hypothetical protein CXG45_19310 [Pseudomonas plecoglossicida]
MPGYFVLWWLRQRSTCGSGRAREADDAVDGTGFAGVRGLARSHKYRVISSATPSLWERVYPRMGRFRVSGGRLGFVEIKRQP